MKKSISRILSFLLVACCLMGLMAPAALAAPVAEATIDTSKLCSITLYKYDYTNSHKDGIWDDSYVSDGLLNQDGVNDVLNDGTGSTLGNTANGSVNGYAIKGVEFSYLKIADITTYSEVENGVATVMVLYGINKNDALLEILGLEDGSSRYVLADNGDVWYFESNILNVALRNALEADPTSTKDALEAYMVSSNAVAMPLTNEDGMSKVENLPVGLYILVETKVPEMVTSTTNPFFLSLPMTSVNGSLETESGTYWNYDPVIYPKNETGIVTLEKTVREALDDTGKHIGSLTDIHDGYAHTATASAGDVVEYQIISTLPTITSGATYLSVYTFTDVLSKGQTYNKYDAATGLGGLKIEWFSDKECKNLVATWAEQDGKFDLAYTENADETETMTITMSAAGLAEINTAAGSFANVNNNVNGDNTIYAGYSNYTVRITYSATLNSDASVNYGDKGNDNDVSLMWSRTSTGYYDVITDDCHVYTYGINLEKTFKTLNGEILSVEDALDKDLYSKVSFKVQNTTDSYWVKAELNAAEGVYYVTDHVATEAEATSFVPVTAYTGTANEAHGRIIIKGLEDDTYVLTETTTANGYSLLKDNITITISTEETTDSCSVYADEEKLGLTQNDGRYTNYLGDDLKLANIPQVELEHKLLTASATVDGNAAAMINDTDATGAQTDSANALVDTKVVNTEGWDLPQTGDDSLILLTSLGTLMAVSAVILIVMICKFNKKEKENA